MIDKLDLANKFWTRKRINFCSGIQTFGLSSFGSSVSHGTRFGFGGFGFGKIRFGSAGPGRGSTSCYGKIDNYQGYSGRLNLKCVAASGELAGEEIYWIKHMGMRSYPKYNQFNFNMDVSLKKELPENTIGQRIKKARLEKGWTIKYLSQKTGISETSISRYERDLIQPELKTIKKLSETLNKSIAFLSDFNNMPENTLGEKIKKYRYLKGWSYRKLAKEANVDLSTIMKIETGKTNNPITSTIEKIEKALSKKISCK